MAHVHDTPPRYELFRLGVSTFGERRSWTNLFDGVTTPRTEAARSEMVPTTAETARRDPAATRNASRTCRTRCCHTGKHSGYPPRRAPKRPSMHSRPPRNELARARPSGALRRRSSRVCQRFQRVYRLRPLLRTYQRRLPSFA